MKAQISVTSKYDSFKFFPQNRAVVKSAVKRIAESINEIGYITAFPILVDKNMFIIDGQHRFEACKTLKIPVHYVIATTTNGKSVDANEVMISLNAKARGAWQLNEYTKHYTVLGTSKFHKHLFDFESRFKIGVSNSVSICMGAGSLDTKTWSDFKAGKEFPIWRHADECGVFVEKCDILPFYKTSYFVRAVIAMFPRTTIKQREKLLLRIGSLTKQPSRAAYLAMFENFINRGLHNEDGKVALTV